MYRNFRYGGVGMHGAFIRGPKQYSENKAGPLIIENINRMGYRNHAAHHTDVFVINVNDEDLVLRRGQEFTIELQCNRNFDVDTDLLEISMELGEEGDCKIGTLINIPLGVDLDPLHWGGAIRDVKDDSVVVEIMSSCESIIGEWTLKAVARQPWDPTFDPPAAEQDVIMLFNPWCPYDDVYMADEAEINEYVMNENGILWKGSHDKMTPAKWLYGQFEEVSLRAAMMILGLSTTAKSYMKSAAIVTRVLTQMVNANDNDGGILVGRWSGKYEGGTRPTGWNGTEPILAEWIKNRRSVKYAQCWVFCGVLTTICRTLGIPARSITNYTSAHDTDGSLTIDFHFDARTYQFMKKESPDSTWNFHCWNEAYMKRGDLPPKYHGWQAIDSTPQELSGSAMRCGPASVKAIKEGNILQEFDVPFVFSEVNGDVVYWLLNDDGSREFFSNDAERVGKNISTKMVGTDERNDVTKEYKEADDSYKERIAFLSALRYSKPKDLANMASGLFDTNISFEVQAPETGDVKAVLTVRNDSTEERNCNFSVTVLHSNDIGEHRGDVKHERGKLSVPPNSTKTWSMTMTAKEWLNIVVDDGRLMFYMEGLVKETGHKFAFQEGPRIDKPDLAVTASTPTPSTKNPFEVTVTFENPTAIEITDCVFTIEGVGMDKIKAVKVPNVGPKQSVSAKITLIPRLPGNRRIAAGFDSKQITDVVGFLDLVIKKGKAPESGDDDKDDEDFTYSNVPVLRVEEVDLNVVENGKDHHTSDYAHNWKKDTLVIRRGEPFEVDVTFNRPYDRTTDRISLRLQTGRHPKKSEENDKRLVIAKDLSKVDWGYQRTNANSDGSKCKFRIKTAPDACVSEWKLIIRTKLPKAAPGLKDMAKHDTSTIFVLFNAWCKEDQVFLDDEDKRVEYVQNQTGRIFKNNKRPARKWWFDQCEEISLNTAMMLLNRCGSRFSSRGNATRVSRDISQMCNNNDNDDGILIGNWTGEYGDGTKPTQWARSKNIFKQWWKNNHKGVKYGQCWVFSAIVTSICRSLGIPARSVTNFGSAHDTDLSLTIDKYFYEDGTPANYSGDSVWNFHVWNEAWFRRLDLPDRFNGWQAFDSTPQEQSGGRMRCGPASVNAIYDGDLQHPYDARFIFAEINSDRVYWTIKADGSKVVDKVRKGSIGYQLATKAVGRNTREDIKGNYKCEEGSEAKRRQVAMTAMKHSADEAVQEWYKKGSGKKEEVTSLIQYQAPENGDVEVTMELENTGSKNRTVKAYLIAVATYNNGFVGDKIKAQNEDVQLAAGEKKTVRIGIKATEWLNTVKSDGLLTVHCGFKVDGTGETDFDAITIDLEKPELEVTVSNKRPKLKQDVTVTVVFTNPLDLELTNCTMTLDGDGIDLTEKQLKQKIPPHGKIKETFTIIPTQTRGQDILATFDSDQLTSIDGSATISPVV